MRKFLNKPWFVVTMVVIAVALAGRSVLTGMAAFSAPAPIAAAVAATESGDGATSAEAVKLSARDALKALPIPLLKRDPFAIRREIVAEAAPVKAPEPDLVDKVHLSALWTQNGETLILLNDQICRVGDALGRLRVESVNPNGVWIAHWKGRDFVALGGDFTLTTPAEKKPAGLSSL